MGFDQRDGPDATDPGAAPEREGARGGEGGVEQPAAAPAGRSGEEGGQESTAAETFDEEGAGLAAKE